MMSFGSFKSTVLQLVDCLGNAAIEKIAIIWLFYIRILPNTVEPPNNGHIGGRSLVRCKEAVPISEVG